ncbi:MAG: hypothetical protein LUE96_09570 [Lachnospiraceae bacterium]|nr:hypothetical protein [Lachnospiraceae bacterium]
MEEKKIEKKTIKFQSVTLFNELLEKGQLRSLISVKSNGYPEYCFKATDRVTHIVGTFMATHDLKCDRSFEDWSVFEEIIINAETKPETIVTRNLGAVKRIVSEGYGYMLRRTGVDQYKKKFFVFYSNDRIIEIKNEEDAKSKERYENGRSNHRQNYANTQMSQLLKKAMEETK